MTAPGVTPSAEAIRGPLFTKRTGVLPQGLMKSRNCEIRIETFPITLKFDCSAAEIPERCEGGGGGGGGGGGLKLTLLISCDRTLPRV